MRESDRGEGGIERGEGGREKGRGDIFEGGREGREGGKEERVMVRTGVSFLSDHSWATEDSFW